MEIAVLFDEASEYHRFYAGHTALQGVLGTGVLQRCGRILVVRAGSVLLRRANAERLPSLIDEVFFGDSWRRGDPERLRESAASSMIFAWLISNLDMSTTRELDRALSAERSYLGSMAVNRLVPSQLALFRRSLPLLLRVHGQSCRLFFRRIEPDGRDEAVFSHISALGFASVEWEDVGLRDTLFDGFDTDDHFERLEALRYFLSATMESAGDGADEVLLLLEDLNPQLAATLGTAARAHVMATSEEDLAHVGLSARRYIEQLADAIYPGRSELVDGRDVSKTKVKNRVWAFLNQMAATSSNATSLDVGSVGKVFDRVLDDANKILHAAPTRDEARSLLLRLALLTVSLLSISDTTTRDPYSAYATQFRSMLKKWMENAGSK